MSTAYLLVSHGSSDPRHRQGLMRLAQTVGQHLLDPTWVGRQGQPLPQRESEGVSVSAPILRVTEGEAMAEDRPLGTIARPSFRPASAPNPEGPAERQHPMPLVGTATLEASALSLAEQITLFGRRAMALGVTRLVVVPLFLLQGVHVMEDLPAEIAQAQTQLPPQLSIHQTVHLGGYQGLRAFIANRFAQTHAVSRLLVAHGSRRPGSNRTLEQTAAKLNATVAFWAMAPGLEAQVIELMQAGHRHIVVAPYFVFAGGITDSITQQTEALAERFPRLRLRLLPPLGSSVELARVVSDVALTAATPDTTAANPLPLGQGIRP
jgi:sirohydrochlorin cobaltochelatase